MFTKSTKINRASLKTFDFRMGIWKEKNDLLSKTHPGEENGNPLQYSDLENSMDRGAWQAIVHGVTKSWTQLSNFQFT